MGIVMFDTQKFGANFARLRKNSDLTQSDLADKLGVTRQSISKYECGDSFPDVSILILAAEQFGVSLDTLISGGGPTQAEAAVLSGSTGILSSEELVNLAPLLRPSILDKIVDGYAKHGVDLSNLVVLAQYLNDETTLKMLEKATFDTIEPELLQKLIPFIDEKSKYVLFEKIIDGVLDYHCLRFMMPYMEFMYSHVEAAVVEGALPWDALEIMREAMAETRERRDAEIKEEVRRAEALKAAREKGSN